MSQKLIHLLAQKIRVAIFKKIKYKNLIGSVKFLIILLCLSIILAIK
jgi:hypothetical protein